MSPAWWLLVPAAYLLGTVSVATVLARRSGRDALAEGSGNPGATNVARLAGWRAGLLVLVLDFAKGAVPAAIGLVFVSRTFGLVLGAAAVLGHVFPATRRLRGGKGVATAAGVMVVLYPLASLVFTVVFFAVLKLTKTASLASLALAIGFPVLVAAIGAPWQQVALLAFLGALLVIRHLGNVRRLVSGTELGFKPGTDRDDGTEHDHGGPM